METGAGESGWVMGILLAITFTDYFPFFSLSLLCVCLSLLWSTCAPSEKKNVRIECWMHGKCSRRESGGGARGGVQSERERWKRDRNRESCLWVYFELHYPYYRWVSALHPLLNPEDAGGPARKKTPINLSLTLAIHLSSCPFIHQLIWWQSTHSIRLFFCLSSIFQIIRPSTHPSVHPSSNSSTHLLISPSFIHLSTIFPSVHTPLLPSISGGSIKSAPQLFKVRYKTNRLHVGRPAGITIDRRSEMWLL